MAVTFTGRGTIPCCSMVAGSILIGGTGPLVVGKWLPSWRRQELCYAGEGVGGKGISSSGAEDELGGFVRTIRLQGQHRKEFVCESGELRDCFHGPSTVRTVQGRAVY